MSEVMRLPLSPQLISRLREEASARHRETTEFVEELLLAALSQLPPVTESTTTRIPGPILDLAGLPVTNRRRCPEGMFTVEEVAEALHVTKRTVYAMVHRKDLPAPLHIGKYACWKHSDVQEFLDRSYSRRGLRRRRVRREPAA